MKCPYCKKDLTGLTRKGNPLTLKRHAGNCVVRKVLIEEMLTKEFLVEHLIRRGESSNHIARVVLAGVLPPVEFTAGLVIEYARKLGVPCRTIVEANGTTSVVRQRKQTCRRRYGVSNPSQTLEVKEKKKNKAMAVYGCENVFQAEEIKEKSKRTCLMKYGVESYTQTEEYARKHGYQNRRSSQHRWVESYLTRLGVDFDSEVGGKFHAYNQELDRSMSPIPDVVLKNVRVIIEIYGDLWHANPDKYGDDESIPVWGGPTSAREIRLHDAIRKRHLEQCGYRVFVLWESQINHNRKEVRRLLKEWTANANGQN